MSKPWMCMWERRLFHRSGWWRLVHDGQENPGQFQFPPEEIRFYTRTYRLCLDGELLSTWVRFVYDLREGDSTVKASIHEQGKPGQALEETLELDVSGEVEVLDVRQT